MKSGSEILHNAKEGGYLAVHPEYSTPKVIPRCKRPVVNGTQLPVLLASTPAAAQSVSALPADYDGWLAYTAYNSSYGFSSFLGYFSVPDIPKSTPQIIYLFTGLQNKDWWVSMRVLICCAHLCALCFANPRP